MEHLSQHEEEEVAQDRRLQNCLQQQQLKMAQLVCMVERSPCSIRLQLHLLSELTASGLWNSSSALISPFSYVSFYFILILSAV